MSGRERVGDAAVHWRSEGSGPAIVLLHGFPLSGETWDGVIARLRDRFTCHTLDLIGLGRSHSASDADYASEGQARALQAALRQLGVDAYALVGNDSGGWVARELTPVVLEREAYKDPRFKDLPDLRDQRYQSFLSVPMLFQNVRIGVLNVKTRAVHRYSGSQIRLLSSIAAQAAARG